MKTLVREGSGVNAKSRNTYYKFDSVKDAKDFIKASKQVCFSNPVEGYTQEEWEEYVDGSYELITEPSDWELDQAI